MSARTGTDLRVACSIDQQWHPADLEIEPDEREHIGVPQPEDEARLRFNEVRVLIALADVDRPNAVPADCLRDVAEIGCTCNDGKRCPLFGCGRRAGETEGRRESRKDESELEY